MSERKIGRKITFQLFKDKKHDASHVSSMYKYNTKTGEKIVDPYKSCKGLDDVRQVLLVHLRKELLSFFNDEGYDFVLAKINKRGMSHFQQIFPDELVNSINFIKDR